MFFILHIPWVQAGNIRSAGMDEELTGLGRSEGVVAFEPGAIRWGAPLARRRRGALGAVVATLRPRQWVKNVLVVAAAGAAGALGHDDVPVRVSLTCVAFCLLASGMYAINDVIDAPEDRLHPAKCRRPVAAGELSPLVAGGAWIGAGGRGVRAVRARAPVLSGSWPPPTWR